MQSFILNIDFMFCIEYVFEIKFKKTSINVPTDIHNVN